MDKDSDKEEKIYGSEKAAEYYERVKSFISEFEFYKDDIRFIDILISRFLDDMLKHENLDELRESMIRLHRLKSLCNTLLKNLKQHLQNLGKISESTYKDKIDKLEESQNKLEETVKSFKNEFQNIKHEIYSFADDYLEIKKAEKQAIEEEKIRNSRDF
ncbi:hypothetical protein ACOCEA_14010 [Maribacter sp. CXY002]|uniref:hypothetical protein n=1 Tax=Maribacter luteocoastalis TaxID=3407671 RepID=UPI003B67D89A